MSDYQHSVEVIAPAQTVYDFVTEPANMPLFLPTLREATADGAGRIEMRGAAGQHPYVTTGSYHLDPDELTMHWNSDDGLYKGRLQVVGDDASCQVCVTLDFAEGSAAEEQIKNRSLEGSRAIQTALISSLDQVKRICEGDRVPAPDRDAYLG